MSPQVVGYGKMSMRNEPEKYHQPAGNNNGKHPRRYDGKAAAPFRPRTHRYCVRSSTMSKRSHTLMSGRASGSLASMRKALTFSGLKWLDSRVTRSTSFRLPVREAASMYLYTSSGFWKSGSR